MADALREEARTHRAGSDRQFQLVGAFSRAARATATSPGCEGRSTAPSPTPGSSSTRTCGGRCSRPSPTLGAAAEDEIAAELRRDDTNAGRERAFHARAALPTPEAKAEAWRLAVEEDGQPNAVIEALASGWNRAVDQSLLQDYVPRYFDMLLPVWRAGRRRSASGSSARSTRWRSTRSASPAPRS